MPSLDDSYRELVRLVAADSPLPSATTTGDGWEAVARLILARGRRLRESDAAIAALESAGLGDPESLSEVGTGELVDTLAELGVRITPGDASLLLKLAGWFASTYPDNCDPVASSPPIEALRDGLRAVRGVGPATADAILLALGLPSFPVERGIYRILVRHGWCDITAEYDEARDALERHAGGDRGELVLLAAGLSRWGSKYCGPSAPKCDRCPLQSLLPESGPINPFE